MAQSLISIGNVDHGVVVHGCGLDEISPLGNFTILKPFSNIFFALYNVILCLEQDRQLSMKLKILRLKMHRKSIR
jgi:hypothetical protein